MTAYRYVRFFEEIGIEDVPLVGGKNASLGEMYRELVRSGRAHPERLRDHGRCLPLHARGRPARWSRCTTALDDLDADDVADLARRAKRAREIVYGAGIPDDLAAEITAGYARLQEQYGEEVSLAVRSSATAEDLPTASFAGQQETFLNVHGEREPARRLPALLREPLHRPRDPLPDRPGLRPLQGRAVDRRDEDGALGPRRLGRVLLARHRVRASATWCSSPAPTGSARTSSRARSTRTSSTSTSRPSRPGTAPCCAGCSATRRSRWCSSRGSTRQTTRNIPTPKADRERYCIDGRGRARARRLRDQDRAPLRPPDGHGVGQGRRRRQALHRAGAARDGRLAAQARRCSRRTSLDGERRGAGRGSLGRREDRVGHGAPDHATSSSLREFEPGEVLVADTTTPDWEPVMKMAAAIVTNRGGRTCHAAIIARELGVPAVVGTGRRDDDRSPPARR